MMNKTTLPNTDPTAQRKRSSINLFSRLHKKEVVFLPLSFIRRSFKSLVRFVRELKSGLAFCLKLLSKTLKTHTHSSQAAQKSRNKEYQQKAIRPQQVSINFLLRIHKRQNLMQI